MKYTPQANTVQVSNGKVLVPFTSGYATGWIEGPPVLPRGPIARPTIRMPYLLWRQAISFLVDVFDEIGCEAQILFFKKGDEWKLFCPEQNVSPATTESEKNSRYNDASFNFLASNGYENVGSIHSHCKMSAFASGTDKNDEMDKCDGFHITIGKMDQDVLDYHLRSVVTIFGEGEEKAIRQSIPFYIEEFIDQSPNLALADELNLPTRIRKQILEWFYFNREELPEYPEHWQEKVVEKKYVVSSHQVYSPVNHNGKQVQVQGKTYEVKQGALVEIPEQKDFEKKADSYIDFWEAQAKLREEEEARLDREEDDRLKAEVEAEYRKEYEEISMHL